MFSGFNEPFFFDPIFEEEDLEDFFFPLSILGHRRTRPTRQERMQQGLTEQGMTGQPQGMMGQTGMMGPAQQQGMPTQKKEGEKMTLEPQAGMQAGQQQFGQQFKDYSYSYSSSSVYENGQPKVQEKFEIKTPDMILEGERKPEFGDKFKVKGARKTEGQQQLSTEQMKEGEWPASVVHKDIHKLIRKIDRQMNRTVNPIDFGFGLGPFGGLTRGLLGPTLREIETAMTMPETRAFETQDPLKRFGKYLEPQGEPQKMIGETQQKGSSRQ